MEDALARRSFCVQYLVSAVLQSERQEMYLARVQLEPQLGEELGQVRGLGQAREAKREGAMSIIRGKQTLEAGVKGMRNDCSLSRGKDLERLRDGLGHRR